MPSAAPDKVRLFIARITISASNKIIITLLTFSIPFCMPLLHTKNPAIAITAIHIIISTGLDIRFENTLPTCSAVIPLSNVPVANLKK